MLETIKNFLDNVLTTPAIIIDSNGRIIYGNSQARLFNGYRESEDLSQVFGDSKLNYIDLLQQALTLEQYNQMNVELLNENGKSNWNIKANKITTNEGDLVIINFIPEDDKNEDSTLSLNFNEKEIKKYLESETIRKVLDKVRNSFPFTFIGRQKFIHDIDSLNEIVWLRDAEGKFLITNKKFNSIVNLKLNQIQNKSSREIFSSDILEVFNIVDRYLLKTSRAILFSLPIEKDSDSFIQIPLLDLDKKIVVIVGFSVDAKKDLGINLSYEKISKYSQENSFIINNDFNLDKYSDKFYNTLSELYGLDFENAFEIFKRDYLEKAINLLVNSFQEKFIKENAIIIEKRNFDLYLAKILEQNEIVGFYGYLTENSALNQQEEMKVKMYDTIMHKSPQPMFIYDVENLKFLDVNQAALKMYGYLREEFLEKDLTDLYLPEEVQTLIENSTSPSITNDFTGPWRHKHKNGSTIFVQISKTQIDYNGRKAHFNIIKDVAEQISDEMEIKKLSFIVKHSDDIIIITDSDGFITNSSEAALSYFAFTKSEYGSKSFLSLISDEDRAKINAEIFHSNVKDTITVYSKLRKQNENSINAVIVAQPIMSFQKQIEAFSVIIKPEIKKDVVLQQVEATKATTGLDASFLSNLFHELLTPINVMIGFIQDITENLEHPSREQQEAIDIIRENQQMLLQIIDNAVEFSNIEQNKIELIPEKILFIDLLEGIEDSIRKIARNKKVDFNYGKISSSLRFTNDKQRISTLISLLTRFGILITKKEKIYLSAYQRDDLNWLVSIRDDRNNISDDLVKNFLRILNDDENELKHAFGISRFTIRLFRKLMILLGGEAEVIRKYGDALEFAIIFPYEISFEKIKIEEAHELADIKAEKSAELTSEPKIEKNESVQPQLVSKEIVSENIKEKTVDIQNIIEDKSKQMQPEPVFKQVEKVISSMQQSETKQDIEEKQEENIPSEKETGKIEVKPKFSIKELSCLCLEDQIDSQILFKVQMKDLKAIDFAPSFEKALPLLQSNKYDFILMDINLQGEYNGLDALRAIQKMKGFEHVPIIAATAYVLPGDKDRFVAAGFTDFITKPILKDKMENVLKKIFQ